MRADSLSCRAALFPALFLSAAPLMAGSIAGRIFDSPGKETTELELP